MINIEEYRDYCLAKKGVTESFPFDESTLVFKVGGKMFGLCGVNNFAYINLKCDPDRALELREEYSAITPAFHMSKVHWNSIGTADGISKKMILELIDHSYDLVYNKLTKKVKLEVKAGTFSLQQLSK